MIDLIEAPDARADWLAARRKVIGASDISALVVLNKHCTAYDVWNSKVNGTDADENEAMKWGKRFEDDIIDATEEYLGIGIRPNDRLFTHPDVSYFGATPDGFASDSAVVEVKYTSLAIDGPLRQHEIQVQWQMFVCGAERGYLAYLAPNHQFHVFIVERDNEFIETLATVAHDFWRNHVLTGIPPAAHTSEDVAKMFPRHTPGKVVDGDEEAARRIAELTYAQEQRKYWEAIEKQLKSELVVAIGDAEAMAVEGRIVATYKASADSTALDTKRLAAEHPEIVAAYQITKPGSRRFLLK